MESDQEINQRELSELPEEPLLPLRNFFPDEASETLAILAKRSSLMEEIRRTDNKFDIFDIKEEIIKVEGEIWQAKVKAAILGSVVNFLESREKIVLALRNFDTRVKNNDGTYILDTDYYERIVNETVEQGKLPIKRKWRAKYRGGLTLEETGRVIGSVSRERVRQIEKKASRKISKVLTDENFLFYCKTISQDDYDGGKLLEDFRKRMVDGLYGGITSDTPLRNRLIKELGLSRRVELTLWRAEMKTIGDIMDFLVADSYPDAYIHMRNLGFKRIAEIKTKFSKLSNYLTGKPDRD